MTASLYFEEFSFAFPPKEAPLWKEQVQRWYQLDAFSFGLADFEAKRSKERKPDLVLMASAGASNVTDFEFVKSGAEKAQIFSHTLPNVRASSLFKILDHSGIMLTCLKDPQTLLTSLSEAYKLQKTHPLVWIYGVSREISGEISGNHSVQWIEVRAHESSSPFEMETVPEPISKEILVDCDKDLLLWLRNPSSSPIRFGSKKDLVLKTKLNG